MSFPTVPVLQGCWEHCDSSTSNQVGANHGLMEGCGGAGDSCLLAFGHQWSQDSHVLPCMVLSCW